MRQQQVLLERRVTVLEQHMGMSPSSSSYGSSSAASGGGGRGGYSSPQNPGSPRRGAASGLLCERVKRVEQQLNTLVETEAMQEVGTLLFLAVIAQGG
jgi:hypothetical protein